jgi:hypothetical protein
MGAVFEVALTEELVDWFPRAACKHLAHLGAALQRFPTDAGSHRSQPRLPVYCLECISTSIVPASDRSARINKGAIDL